jgi:hypothetical protein
MAIVERMLSIFYGAQYLDMKAMVCSLLDEIDIKNRINMKSVLSATILHMITKLETRTGIKISTFILMLDEFVTFLRDLRLDDEEISTYTTNLRSMILNESIIRKDLAQAIVISSLEVSPVVDRDNNRDVHAINIPKELNCTQIVNAIWKPRMAPFLDSHNVSAEIQEQLFRRMEIVASSMNTIPRIVEVATEVIEQETKVVTPPTSIESIDDWFHQFLCDVMDEMREILIQKYAINSIPLHCLCPVVFEKDKKLF